MRIASIITAILVVIGIFFFVFERDALKEMSGADVATQESETVDATPPAERIEASSGAVKVVVRNSTARELESAVVLRGQTQAARTVQVSSETSGRVISEPLRKGAYVDAGQLLCELDPGTRETRLAEAKAGLPTAEARVVEARARLNEAETSLNNANRLADGGYASDTQVISAEAGVESARAALSAAQAGVESARAAVASAEKEIENLSIRAPFAGLLETDTAELGQLMQPGALCATVIQLDPIKLIAYAPEAEVDRIEVGTLAGARLVSGQEVSGRVTFLSRSADPATRTFRVEIEIPNTDFAIRDGQTVEMAIRSDGKLAHLIAQSSLTLDDDGALGVRVVDEDNTVAFMPVSVLRDTREGIWVTGLPEEITLITVGQEYVRAGVTVEPHLEEMSQ